MRHLNDDGGAEGETPKVRNTRTVRFSAVVAAAGKPDVYLPLFNPKQDRSFMRAVREHRVLSIRQEPTSKRSDFGVVGFDERKHTTFLVFAKPLTTFMDARIVGIKYDVIGGSPVVASTGPPPSKTPKTRGVKPKRPATTHARSTPPRHIAKPSARSASVRVPNPMPRPAPKKSEPPKRPKLQPRGFRVRLRITTERDVTVKAMTKAEAKAKAQADVYVDGNVRVMSVKKTE